jgi:arylsulfatase A-like enzyme
MRNSTFVLLILLISMANSSVLADEKSKPNIILCMADDLGWGDVGFNGNSVIKTPHLDAMALAGLKFNRFYSGAPVCSPTRGSALTGRHPYRYGIVTANAGHIRKGEVTLAEALKTQGYVTGHFGKWHIGTLTKTIKESNRGGPKGKAHFAPPWENGFDQSFSTEAKVPTWDPLLRPKNNNSRNWWDPVMDASQAKPYGTNYWANGKRVTEPLRGDDSKIIMDRAIPFIREATAEKKPFFTVIWFHAPHLPVVAGPKYTKMYEGHGKYAQHFYGCITALDEQVGRLRKELRTLGVAENTMLWFCSDNGPEGQSGKAPGSAGPFRGRKRSLYEGGVRVPGILEWPSKVKPGSVTDFPSSTLDYFPTVLDVLGFPLKGRPNPIDGVSLLPMLDGTITKRPQPIGFQSAGQVSLIDNRFKLIRVGARKRGKNKQKQSKTNPAPFMLFDLIDDPAETTDIAGKHSDVVTRMQKRLEAWQASCRRSLEGNDYSAAAETQ